MFKLSLIGSVFFRIQNVRMSEVRSELQIQREEFRGIFRGKNVEKWVADSLVRCILNFLIEKVLSDHCLTGHDDRAF